MAVTRKHANRTNSRTRYAAAAAAVVGALAAGGAAAGAGAEGPVAQASGTVKVSMGDNFFKPAIAKVSKGSKVKWINKGAVVHNATFGSDGTGDLDPGEARKLKFGSVGTFKYVCTIHEGMKGKIKVKPGG